MNFGTPNRPNLKNVLPPITQQQVGIATAAIESNQKCEVAIIICNNVYITDTNSIKVKYDPVILYPKCEVVYSINHSFCIAENDSINNSSCIADNNSINVEHESFTV